MNREALIAELQALTSAQRASAAPAHLDQHSQDQSAHAAHQPDAVVWPETTAEVSRIAALANRQRISITAWGAGSSLEGNSIPLRGGIVMDFTLMNRVLALHAEDFQVVVQPGIFYKDMNKVLAKSGLFFAPDPGANASIGGMVANNAAGTRTVKYGATRDNVLALEVVLADGQILRTGCRSTKQSAGYDLTRLLVGSEGTLALVTEATLRLAPLPEHFSAVVAAFPTTNEAAQAVFGIMGSGLNPAALELLDTATVTAINNADALGLHPSPTLFVEFHAASEATLAAELGMVEEICRELQCSSFQSGVGRTARDRLWAARHGLGELFKRIHPGQSYLITDVSVPISQYAALVAEGTAILAQLKGVSGYLFGHAGDGNLHSHICFADDAANYARLQRTVNDHLVEKALALGGTCTGEHGVGIGKQKYMLDEHGAPALDLMRRIKALFDPHDILNPGKILALEGDAS